MQKCTVILLGVALKFYEKTSLITTTGRGRVGKV